MKLERLTAVLLSAAMAAFFTACGGTASQSAGGNTGTAKTDASQTDTSDTEASQTESTGSGVDYAGIKLGETGKDIKVSLKMLTNRTDMMQDDYKGTSWKTYVEKFNADYPDITVTVEGVTNYAEDSLTRLQSGDWGDIMLIPEVNKKDLASYFCSFGDLDTVSSQVNYASKWTYRNQVYGIPTFANANGVVYNKKVFSDAGITAIPQTTEEFLQDLKMIKEKEPDVIPLYTNYAAGWTMNAWDPYCWGGATGDSKYRYQTFVHAADPFKDPGDGTHAFNVYKVLYDAVKEKLTEEDYTTTDWEGSKGMINNGQIGCMVLGSWSYEQMRQGGDHGDDIGYMPFPMTVGGKQYCTAAPDYNFGINVNSSDDNKKAAAIFIKWMTEKSGWSYEGGGLPIKAGDTNFPDLYKVFTDNNVQFVEDAPALDGEEDLLNKLNADSELMMDEGGKEKVQAIVEAASTGSKDFAAIMDEWNQKWSDAQKADNVEVK